MSSINTEVLIIGSGIAGSIMAYKLAQANFKVTVLEAGPKVTRGEIVNNFAKSPYFDLSSGYPNTPHAPRPSRETVRDFFVQTTPDDPYIPEYLTCLGGTTWHWLGGCIRFISEDFKLKSKYNVGIDWPITYQDLADYYTKAEQELGMVEEGNLPTYADKFSYYDNWVAAKLKGSPYELKVFPIAINVTGNTTRSRCQGFSTCMPICPSGAKYSAIEHVAKAAKLGVNFITNARVDKIISKKNNLISHVEYNLNGTQTLKAYAKTFILAANGIESPRLLLMSANENSPQGIANFSNQVGRNYMDHAGVTFSYKVKPKVFAGIGPQSRFFIDNYRAGEFRSDQAAFKLNLSSFNQYLAPIIKEIENSNTIKNFTNIIQENAYHKVLFDGSFETLPNPTNRITLDYKNTDPAGRPKIKINYKLSTYETNAFTKAKTIVNEIGSILDGKLINFNIFKEHDHLMGTLRMGTAASSSVTNSFGQSHDHKNLFIAGSSLFPTSSPVNPTLTIVTLALRTCDFIKTNIQAIE